MPSLVLALAQRLQRAKIKARIAEVRLQVGLTQAELGDALVPPVHWRTIQNWESQQNETVPFRHLESIAEVTGTTSAWLLHGDVPGPDADRDDLLAERHQELLDRLDAVLENQRIMLARLGETAGRPT